MTPQERQLVDELFERLSRMESAPRDPDAAAAIAQGLRSAPNAIYPLVQTVLVQDEALRRAHHRIEELEGQGTAPNQGGGGFLDTMRGAILGSGQSGQGQSRSSVPNVPPPDAGQRPVWNSGQVLQQSPAGRYDQGAYGQSQYSQPQFGQPQGGYGQPYPPQAPMGGMGGGGSFLGTAAAAAAGMVGGSLLLNSIRSMMGGSHYGLADTGSIADRSTSRSPWSDQSDSTLARDAGIDDVGSSSGRADDRAGFFDTASNDDDRYDVNDTMDTDDFDAGGNGDSDFA